MFLGAGRISLLDRCDFLGILCKVWKWEGKVLEWNDWAMSPVLRLEIEYSGRVGERMRLLCGVLTNTQSYISELGQTVPEQKQETSVCANCMQVLKTSVGQSPCVPGEQADGFNCSTGTGTENSPCLWVSKYLCCLDVWHTLLNLSAFNDSHQLKCLCNKMGRDEQIQSFWCLVNPAPHPQQADKKGSVATEWMWTYIFLSGWRIGILGVVCWL